MAETAVVTGANRGLGKALAAELCRRGYRVFAGTREPVARAPGAPGAITPLPLDVLDPASLESAVARVTAEAGPVDVLVNNAAINPRPADDAPLGELDFEAINHTFDVNAVGALRVVQAFVPLLELGSRKLIVNVSSEAGSLERSCRDRGFGYCMSKAAMNMQTTMLDLALEPKGFNVLAVHPGWMRTDMGGPNAHLSPDESARGLADVIASASRETPRFVQWDGQPYPW